MVKLLRKLGERAVVSHEGGDVVVDVRNQPFPKYLFAIEHVVENLPPNTTVKLIVSHQRFANDLKVWCHHFGHHFLECLPEKRLSIVRIRTQTG